jgi:hypothetical protein
MKRYTVAAAALVLLVSLGFGAGYWYRHVHSPMQGEMEDYALANILGEVAYARYLEKGEVVRLRNLIDINLNGHLSRVVRYQGSLTDEGLVASKIRTLNAAAKLWEERQPFLGMETESSNQPWWSEWQRMTARNRELLAWAKQQCTENRSLECAPPSRPGR